MTNFEAPPGKFRILTWDNWEFYSSGYTLEEASAPALVSDHDSLEEAVRIANRLNEEQGELCKTMRSDYEVYDDRGQRVG